MGTSAGAYDVGTPNLYSGEAKKFEAQEAVKGYFV
jgi:hypothetical protein